MEAPKTRDLVSFLSSIAPEGKVLVLTDGKNENLYLSARNLSNVSVVPFGGESVYDVLWAYTVVIERSALDDKAEAPAEVEEVEVEPATEAEAELEEEPEAEAEVGTEEDDDA